MFNVFGIFLVSIGAVNDHASLSVTLNQHSVLANFSREQQTYWVILHHAPLKLRVITKVIEVD